MAPSGPGGKTFIIDSFYPVVAGGGLHFVSAFAGATGLRRRVLKRFIVFNLAQCEGLPEALATSPEPLPQRRIIPGRKR